MADRRNFLKRLLMVGGVAAVIPISLPQLKRFTVAVPDRFTYRGFTVYWTGWKTDIASMCEVSQWCAFHGTWFDRSKRCFYASYPGGQGSCFPGDTFDISVKWKFQKIVNHDTSDEDKLRYRVECLRRLTALIDVSVA